MWLVLLLLFSPCYLASNREVRIWYYANEKTWESDVKQLVGNSSSLTGISFGCGHTITEQGTLVRTHNDTFCAKVVKAIGLPTTFVIGSQSNTISQGMRQAMANPAPIVKTLNEIDAAIPANKGWQFDFEPQGHEHPTKHDIAAYPKFLAYIRYHVKKRVTADVASWTPFLSQFKNLAPSVTRIINMETYGAPNKATWLEYFYAFYNETPIDKAAVGLGDWMLKGYTASEDNVRDIFKLLTEKKITEVDVFRFDSAAPYPEKLWWWGLMKQWRDGQL